MSLKTYGRKVSYVSGSSPDERSSSGRREKHESRKKWKAVSGSSQDSHSFEEIMAKKGRPPKVKADAAAATAAAIRSSGRGGDSGGVSSSAKPLSESTKAASASKANKAGEEEIVILDDDEDSAGSGGGGANTSLKTEGPIELCTFNRETITEHDYKTLSEHEYLNDNIINFYLTYLHQQLPSDIRDLIHIYSSHFYSRLKGNHKKDKREEKTKGKTQAELCYDRVKSWTKKIDIFSKRMLIFPICDEDHWFVIIVCNPGLVLSQKRQADFEVARKKQQKLEGRGVNPFLLVLDSLSGTHSTALNKIRSYLQFEYMERKNYPLTFGRDKMNEKHPEIPLQPNSCDCGIFLLHYVELIFKDPGKFLGAILPDLSRWFSEKEIDYKRFDIAQIIKDLSLRQYREQRESNPETSALKRKPKFPKIHYPAKREKPDPATLPVAPKSDPRRGRSGVFGAAGRVPSIPEVPGYNEAAPPPPPPSDAANPPPPPPPPPPPADRGSSRVAKGGPPRTPPYPPPPTDSDSSPSPPPTKRRSHGDHFSSRQQHRQHHRSSGGGGGGGLLSHFPQFISESLKKKDCSVVATRLDEQSERNRKFFKHNRDERRRRPHGSSGERGGGEREMRRSSMLGRAAAAAAAEATAAAAARERVINSKKEMFQELMKGCE